MRVSLSGKGDRKSQMDSSLDVILLVECLEEGLWTMPRSSLNSFLPVSPFLKLHFNPIL